MSSSQFAECIEKNLFTPADEAAVPALAPAHTPDAAYPLATQVDPLAAALPFAHYADLGDDLAERVAEMDESLPVDHPLKLATHLTRSLRPDSFLGDARHCAEDSLGIVEDLVDGNTDGAERRAENVNDQALDGGYGPLVQGPSMVSNLIFDEAATTRRLTDDAAAQGERGMNVALGNYLGDEWYSVLESDYRTPGWTFVPDED